MRIITWNCQGAFRKKSKVILEYAPDILVVQECEHPDKLDFGVTNKKPVDYLWFGDNKNKGLGIFSYSDYRFQLLDCHNPDYKIIAPISVSGGSFDFNLFAIWANNPNDPYHRYIEQVWKAINHYNVLLENCSSILTGDFNSNKIWDKKSRIGNHSDVVDRLADKNIFSAYHKKYNQEQGQEYNPTFFLQRKITKPYHIDYCFLSADLYNRLHDIKIGNYDNWIMNSDHVPVIVDIEDLKKNEC
jgi:exodeoxyribonuclease III